MLDPSRHGPWAVVAGASEGIGAAFAHQLAAAGLGVVLVSRRAAVLESLADDVRAATPGARVRVLAQDLTAADAAEAVRDATADLEVGLLVYNAGADTMAVKFHDRSIDDVMHLVHLNVVTPTRLCHHLGASMRARGRGGIVLLGSMSGLAGTGWVAGYAASKAYDQILAEGLWRELRGDGVDVMALVAGATDTPAHARMGAAVTEEYPPMDPADVAREGLAALGQGPVWVAGDGNRAGFGALSPVPRADVIEMMTRGTQLLFGVTD
jgi:short-subunit dehydrogenase